MSLPSPPPPFSYHYSPGVPELLKQLNCSLAISTYQTGKVVIFSPKDDDTLIQLPRNFNRPMGMAVKGDKWAIACNSEVVVTTNSKGLAKHYPKNPNTYDKLFVPRKSLFTGPLDLHDLQWADEELIGVNTSFSCLVKFNGQYSFDPIWKPSFVSKLVPEDRCHLNGLALVNDQPKYVTALGVSDERVGWKKDMLHSGILMDVENNEIILKGLPVPHSPRFYKDGLYMLLSATGEVIKVDTNKNSYEVITRLRGFLRGVDRHGDYLFVAMSKLRKGTSLFKDAPIAKDSVYCGISIIYLPTGNQIGYITYNNTVEELFEVKVIKDALRPNLLNVEQGFQHNSIITDNEVYWTEKTDQ